MDQLFLIKLIISFIIGSLWITCSSIIAEKFGAKLGGVLAGIPSTALIALFFIGWSQSPKIAAETTSIMFIMIGIDALFIVLYCWLIRYSFSVALISAILLWFIASFSLIYLKFDNVFLSILGYLILLPLSYFIVEHILKIKTIKGKGYTYSFGNIIFRSILSGSVIVLTVLFSKIGGPLFGGTFATFPAVFIATLLITYKSQGKAFSAGLMKTLMISGLTNVFVYAVAVRIFYPSLGLILGTILSFLISLVSAYIVYLFVKRQS